MTSALALTSCAARRRWAGALVASAVALLGSPAGAPAEAAGSDATVAALTALPAFSTPAWGGFRGRAMPETFASPVVGAVSARGASDVVSGFQNGHLYGWHADGRRFLDVAAAGPIRSTPVLVDLNRDGLQDILVSTMTGHVQVFSGSGRKLFDVVEKTVNGLSGIHSSPVAADLDNNGRLWIIATGWDHNLWVWDTAGRLRPGFPLFVQDTIWSSPVIADLNHDGRKDIVFGYDCVGTPGDNCYRDYRAGGGYVTAIDGRGKALPGWPRFLKGQVVWSTPSIADLAGDGRLDVIVGTGLYWPSPAGSAVYAFDAAGHPLPGWPARTRGRVLASPSVGPVLGRRDQQVTVIDEHDWVWLFDRSGRVVPGWPRCDGNCSSTTHAGSVLADVTGSGLPQVVSGGQGQVGVWDGSGRLVAAGRSPGGTAGPSGDPTVTSLGGRAVVLMASTRRNASGDPYGTVLAFTAGVPLGKAPWPQFRQNNAGTGHR